MKMNFSNYDLEKLLQVVSREVLEKYVTSLFKNNPQYLRELFAMEILYKELGIVPEKCEEPLADLCWKNLLIEVKGVYSISDNCIVRIISESETNINQLAKYLALSKTLNVAVIYVFLVDLNEYRIVKLDELVSLIKNKIPSLMKKIDEISNKKLSRITNQDKQDREIDKEIEKAVINLYKKGYSIKKISRFLEISEYTVRKIIVEKCQEYCRLVCPRCLYRMVDYVFYYYCPRCGYRKSKDENIQRNST